MVNIKIPYGRGSDTLSVDEKVLSACLTSGIDRYIPTDTPERLISAAMEAPVASPKLSELAKGKQKVVIIASDHTRPVPSKLIIPPMLGEIRKGNPDAEITILIATGCHRGTTKAELTEKFGEEICKNEKIVVHDCADGNMLTDIGTLPSGGRCMINRIAAEADLLAAEGFIEPHFFAGFSGGRKSVLPGIAGRETVLANHCSDFIASPNARTGILDGNPIHKDMCWAAERAGLKYIVNTVLDENKNVIYAVAGDVIKAHRKGCDFLNSLCRVEGEPSDIVITSNGGYPLDQNVYQSPKGMTAAEAMVNKGGVIIMLAHCGDGHGGISFYESLTGEPDINKLMKDILSRDSRHTVPDQWQVQVLLRVMQKATVIFVSSLDDETVRAMHMAPAHSANEALDMAYRLINKECPKITVIPDGISVISKLK